MEAFEVPSWRLEPCGDAWRPSALTPDWPTGGGVLFEPVPGPAGVPGHVGGVSLPLLGLLFAARPVSARFLLSMIYGSSQLRRSHHVAGGSD